MSWQLLALKPHTAGKLDKQIRDSATHKDIHRLLFPSAENDTYHCKSSIWQKGKRTDNMFLCEHWNLPYTTHSLSAIGERNGHGAHALVDAVK